MWATLVRVAGCRQGPRHRAALFLFPVAPAPAGRADVRLLWASPLRLARPRRCWPALHGWRDFAGDTTPAYTPPCGKSPLEPFG